MSSEMPSSGGAGTKDGWAGHLVRRALVLSLVFPFLAWFFASWVGLGVSILAVGVWWTTSRPGRLYWPVAIALLAATPIATWAQGLPSTNVVGANFGVRHWVANDLVISAVTIASFAALIELVHLDFQWQGRQGRSERMARRVAQGAKGRFDTRRAEASAPHRNHEASGPRERESHPD